MRTRRLDCSIPVAGGRQQQQQQQQQRSSSISSRSSRRQKRMPSAAVVAMLPDGTGLPVILGLAIDAEIIGKLFPLPSCHQQL